MDVENMGLITDKDIEAISEASFLADESEKIGSASFAAAGGGAAAGSAGGAAAAQG